MTSLNAYMFFSLSGYIRFLLVFAAWGTYDTPALFVLIYLVFIVLDGKFTGFQCVGCGQKRYSITSCKCKGYNCVLLMLLRAGTVMVLVPLCHNDVHSLCRSGRVVGEAAGPDLQIWGLLGRSGGQPGQRNVVGAALQGWVAAHHSACNQNQKGFI